MKSSYEGFFAEKMANQAKIDQKTREAVNRQHAVWQMQKEERQNNYARTTSNNVGEANSNIKLREQCEGHIKRLEEVEQRMLSQMQNTLQRKAQAIKTLEDKSRALKNTLEPRNAYTKAGETNQD